MKINQNNENLLKHNPHLNSAPSLPKPHDANIPLSVSLHLPSYFAHTPPVFFLFSLFPLWNTSICGRAMVLLAHEVVLPLPVEENKTWACLAGMMKNLLVSLWGGLTMWKWTKRSLVRLAWLAITAKTQACLLADRKWKEKALGFGGIELEEDFSRLCFAVYDH